MKSLLYDKQWSRICQVLLLMLILVYIPAFPFSSYNIDGNDSTVILKDDGG